MIRQLLTTVALAAFGVTTAMADEVRVYNWSDYIDESLLAKFEEETGIKLIYDVFDSNELLETKMLAGGSGYDIVVPTGDFLERQIIAIAFPPLYYTNLPHSATLWAFIKDLPSLHAPSPPSALNSLFIS